jgi:hypothetical protein
METKELSPRPAKKNQSVRFSPLVKMRSINSEGATTEHFFPLEKEDLPNIQPVPTIAYYTVGTLCLSVLGIIVKASVKP